MKATKLLLFCIIVINSFSSCYQDTGEFFRTTSITLSADSNEKRPGQIINFKIDTDSGIEVTKESVFYIQEITSPASEVQMSNTPNLTSQSITKYKVYAKYKDANSNREYISDEIEVSFDNKKSFQKRVLIEDYTGAWCVNCPTVSYAIEKLKEQTPYAVPVAIHRGPDVGAFDPYHFAGADPLEILTEVANQYPTAKLNRMTNWNYPQHTQTNLNKAIALTTGNPVRLGLAINSSLTGNTVNLDVKVKFFNDYTDNLRLVVYVLENDLVYPQKNNTSFYGGLSVIPNFEHDHVIRATYTNILGDAIPANETFYDNVYSRNFNVAVPSNFENSAKMEFVAFVIGSDNKAINVRSAKVRENEIFEINE